MKAPPQRLFAPGTGAAPPARTGREREQAVLTQWLADLLAGSTPPGATRWSAWSTGRVAMLTTPRSAAVKHDFRFGRLSDREE